MGPVGVGKTFLASALGHSACRARKKVLFIRADPLLKHLHQCRADNSTEKMVRRLIALDVLIIDDFALRPMELIERRKCSSTTLTSSRSVDKWIPLFADPMLAQSILDRLAQNAFQVVIERESCRKRQGPACRRAPGSRQQDP